MGEINNIQNCTAIFTYSFNSLVLYIYIYREEQEANFTVILSLLYYVYIRKQEPEKQKIEKLTFYIEMN
jgi:hypothetical protein